MDLIQNIGFPRQNGLNLADANGKPSATLGGMGVILKTSQQKTHFIPWVFERQMTADSLPD
ncbi:MAG: hypothetical protein P9F75_00585 [Candidatus Contendobacter sp.]|nr:hypothetical protein [Candidatus Contendobacter sp.]